MDCSSALLDPARPNPLRTTPIAVNILGQFEVRLVPPQILFDYGPKLQALIVSLAIRPKCSAPRDVVLNSLWPDRDPELASQSLNTLTSVLRRSLGPVIGGASPICHENGYYRINVEAGISLDVARFGELIRSGKEAHNNGDMVSAVTYYSAALEIYRGDLCSSHDPPSLLERERLRALHLTVTAQIAEYHLGRADYRTALDLGHRLLSYDPCREDAYRLVMRCYVRLGERAEAMRQFRLCEEVLLREFDARPEAATVALFDLVRLDPGRA